MFQKSYNQREIQVDGYRKYLGIHPYTAKTLQYHGKCLLKLQRYDHAIACCLVSYQMYLKVDGIGFTTMRVLSIYGKVMLSKGAVQEGIKKLKLAIQHGEELFGEHDCVAFCYEQLAKAKESINPKDSEISFLRAKALEIRTQFNRKIGNVKHKFSRLDSVNEEDSILKKTFKIFKKPDRSFSYIAIIMLIAVFFRFMLESINVSCDKL